MKTLLMKRQDGFTLVEVMIAAAIMLIAALGIGELVINSVQQDTKTKMKRDFYTGRQDYIYQNKVMPAPSPDP